MFLGSDATSHSLMRTGAPQGRSDLMAPTWPTFGMVCCRDRTGSPPRPLLVIDGKCNAQSISNPTNTGNEASAATPRNAHKAPQLLSFNRNRMPKALSVPVASAVRRVPLHPRADPRRPGTIHRGTHRQPKAAVHAFPELRKIYFLPEHANLSRGVPPWRFGTRRF